MSADVIDLAAARSARVEALWFNMIAKLNAARASGRLRDMKTAVEAFARFEKEFAGPTAAEGAE